MRLAAVALPAVLASTLHPVGLAAQSAAGPAELTVFAAASLGGAFRELGARFERARPGTRVRFNFAGSQQLAVQLEQGAAADVFAAADERWMRWVAARELLASPPAVFAHNRLIVVTPAGDPAGIGRLEDLARPGLKLVIAAPSVPAGAYTRRVLERLARAPGFPPRYAERVLGNVASEEENVRVVAGKVQLGEADAGFVYASDAAGAAAGRLRVLRIPDARNVRADYPIAVLRSARSPAAAAAFTRLVLGPDGREVLRRFGLIPAEGGS